MNKECDECGACTFTIALAGNPNVGKSTIFNRLTGLKQHTGNWPGKTVACSSGHTELQGKSIKVIDTPGTYSLFSSSEEEEIARDYICFGNHNCVVAVTDATCLERNLNLVLQIGEATENLVLCVNLLDEATRKGIHINEEILSQELGIPVVGSSARNGRGVQELLTASCQNNPSNRIKITYPASVEEGILLVENSFVLPERCKISKRFLALKLIEGKKDFTDTASIETGVHLNTPMIQQAVAKAREQIHEEFPTLEISEIIVDTIVKKANTIYTKAVAYNKKRKSMDQILDKIFMSKALGIPIMLALLLGVFWITIVGANYPSELLSNALTSLEHKMRQGLIALGAGDIIIGILIDGMAKTVFWVVSVMLPPMAIFFPLFTLLEDFGYLPRIAFNMDGFFAKAGTCGKQALTTCMGLGCNAAGVTGCRIIDSPRERLIAMLTNTFVPCNGRFPAMITISAMLFSATGLLGSVYSAATLLAIIVFGISITLVISKFLSKTFLKGVPSSFTLELPPYRKPDYLRVIYRSIIDRTLFVLARAVCVAAPAGIVLWISANVTINGTTLLAFCAGFFAPLGQLMGLDGFILIAFLLGFPANEIVVPIILMCYTNASVITEIESSTELLGIFSANGWTAMTAICFLVFSLVHFPCSTTCLTIKKESGSFKWTALGFVLPTILGILLCTVIATLWRLIAG